MTEAERDRECRPTCRMRYSMIAKDNHVTWYHDKTFKKFATRCTVKMSGPCIDRRLIQSWAAIGWRHIVERRPSWFLQTALLVGLVGLQREGITNGESWINETRAYLKKYLTRAYLYPSPSTPFLPPFLHLLSFSFFYSAILTFISFYPHPMYVAIEIHGCW